MSRAGRGGRGGRGGGRGGMSAASRLNSGALPFEIDKELEDEFAKGQANSDSLFPDFFPNLSAPPTEKERKQARFLLDLQDNMKNGPLAKSIDKLNKLNMKNAEEEAKAKANFDAFEGVHTWGKNKNAPDHRIPPFQSFPFEKQYFPKELWDVIDPKGESEDPDARKKKKLKISTKTKLAAFDDDETEADADAEDAEEKSPDDEDFEELEDDEFEEDEEDDMADDYNAERYFSGGDDDHEDGGGAEGGDDDGLRAFIEAEKHLEDSEVQGAAIIEARVSRRETAYREYHHSGRQNDPVALRALQSFDDADDELKQMHLARIAREGRIDW